MPATTQRRRAQRNQDTGPITLVFAGPGEVTREGIQDNIADMLGVNPSKLSDDGYPDPSTREIFPIIAIADGKVSAGVKEVIDFLLWIDAPYTIVYDTATSKQRGVKQLIEPATSKIETDDVAKKVAILLEDAEGKRLVLGLWGQPDGTELVDDLFEGIVSQALDAGIEALDLSFQMHPLSFNDTAAEEPAPEPEPTPAPARRGRRARPADLVETPLPLVDADEASQSPELVQEALRVQPKAVGAELAIDAYIAHLEALTPSRDRDDAVTFARYARVAGVVAANA